jgi:hypothetical protein
MADLGNKMNPFLAGLTGLGEGLLQGYLTRKKMDEEQRQFNEKLAMEQRQNSLLNEFRRVDDLRQQQLATAQINNINSEIETRKQEKPVSDLYENITTVEMGGKLYDQKRNKLTNKFEYFPTTKSNDVISAVKELEISRENRDNANKILIAQQAYNDAMSTQPTESKDDKGKITKFYKIERKQGSPLVFKDEESLRKYAKERVRELKPPDITKVNFWKRKPEDSIDKKEATKATVSDDEIVKKYGKELLNGMKKGHTKESAIKIIRQEYGIK